MTYRILRQWAFLLTSLPLFSQPALTPLQQQVSSALSNYFEMDRENIHMHLNKNIYLTNEKIWLKGYITEKKNKPTLNTTNVYVNLLDEHGQILNSQLYFAENGLFEGHLTIPDTIVSGTYYVQVFTNYMNNYAEDESSMYSITLVDTNDKNFGWQRKVNYDQLEVQFYPEGGIFLEGVSNTIGLHISDCSGLGIALEGIEIIDPKGTVIANTSTNQFGYGRFEIYNAVNQSYRLRYKANGVQKESTLPMPAAIGVTFSVNNYIYPDKAVIKVKTNAATTIPNNTLTFVVQQNDAVSFADVHFAPGTFEQNISIPRNEISGGINSIYLIDSNLKLMAERIIFDPLDTPTKSLLNIVGKNKDSIKVTGLSAIKAGTMSISVFPAASVNQQPEKPIQAGLIFDAYLTEPIMHLDYYLNDFNRKKHYELDHVLLAGTSKYGWEEMMSKPPIKKYESDFGLAVKGTVNSINKGEIYKINMKSTALGFDEFISLDSKNEFVFKNLLAIDSAKIYFLPKDKFGKVLPHRIGYQILNNNRRFIKSFIPAHKQCSAPADFESVLPLPKIENAILLDSISVVGKKNALKYRNRMGNVSAKGFKIAENEAAKNLLGFIAANGFIVSKSNGNVSISSNISANTQVTSSTMSSRTETFRSSLNGPKMRSQTIRTTTRSGGVTGPTMSKGPGPVVFIDDVMIQNYDMLDDYSMSRIDEIYLNKRGNDISVSGSSGIIKVYTKRQSGLSVSPTGSPSVIIKNGFQKYTPFQNPKYDNVSGEGFQKLAAIFWNPIVETDENGTFAFSIPNLYQKAVRIIIEGMDADCTMISEIHLLEIP